MGFAIRHICIGFFAIVLGLAMVVDAFAQQRRVVRKPKPPSCSAGANAQIVRYKVAKGEALPAAIPKPLTKKAGDAEKGLEAVVNPGKGNCLACHEIALVLERVDESDAETVKTYGNHGDIGPSLNGVGARYNSAELRMILVDPKKAFPDAKTIMPAYHARPGSKDVTRSCQRRAMLSAQAIEDIVAYLEGLK